MERHGMGGSQHVSVITTSTPLAQIRFSEGRKTRELRVRSWECKT